MYRGLIAAAGFGTRLQDLSDKRNKVLLDLGGESILTTVFNNFELAGLDNTVVMAGFDADTVRMACGKRASAS